MPFPHSGEACDGACGDVLHKRVTQSGAAIVHNEHPSHRVILKHGLDHIFNELSWVGVKENHTAFPSLHHSLAHASGNVLEVEVSLCLIKVLDAIVDVEALDLIVEIENRSHVQDLSG